MQVAIVNFKRRRSRKEVLETEASLAAAQRVEHLG